VRSPCSSSFALLFAFACSCAAEAPPEWSDVDAGSAAQPDATPRDANGLVDDAQPGPCDGVTCGANAYCENGTCSCEQGFEGDPKQGCEEITAEQAARAELVDIAWAELGYCEGVDNRPYMLDQPGYWCYDFVEWVYEQSSYDIPEPYELTEYYTWFLPEGWRPEPGDLIKFTIQHYGMVAEVSADGRTITTIEGNYSSCVKTREITDASVSYYGTLDDVF